MAYKIIGDSCVDYNDEIRERLGLTTVSLTIDIDSNSYIDNDELDMNVILAEMKASKIGPKTACPSPQQFVDVFEGEAKDIYVVTLSAELSGTYASAVTAKEMYEEDCGDKNIHIFNSRTAAAGQTAIALEIKKVAETGASFEQVVEKVEDYINKLNTLFVLDTPENLEKAGRLSSIKAMLVKALNIKLILCGEDDGKIGFIDKARGMKKGLARMVDLIGERCNDIEGRRLVITYVRDLERAEFVKTKIEERYNFEEVIIVPARGISTVYANDGGIVLGF